MFIELAALEGVAAAKFVCEAGLKQGRGETLDI